MTTYSPYRVTVSDHSAMFLSDLAPGRSSNTVRVFYAQNLRGWQNHVARWMRDFDAAGTMREVHAHTVTDAAEPFTMPGGRIIAPALGSDTARTVLWGWDTASECYWIRWITVEFTPFSGFRH